MTEYLNREDILAAGGIAVGQIVEVGDYGLLDAAVARPQATVFGVDAYQSDWFKAAALMQSLARNHALVDGNKRTAWAAAWTFLHINGIRQNPQFDVDAAEKFVNDVATGAIGEVGDIATGLAQFEEDQ